MKRPKARISTVGIKCLALCLACTTATEPTSDNDRDDSKIISSFSELTPPPSVIEDPQTGAEREVEQAATQVLKPTSNRQQPGLGDRGRPRPPAVYAYIMPDTPKQFLWVFTERLTLYAEPFRDATRLGQLRWGQKVGVVTEQDGWVQISHGVWAKRSELTDRKARWQKHPEPQIPEGQHQAIRDTNLAH